MQKDLLEWKEKRKQLLIKFKLVWILTVYSVKNFDQCCTKKKHWFAATKTCPMLHHILVLLAEIFTIFWFKSPLSMVQLRTNFCSQQINATFWCNTVLNFLECSVYEIFCMALWTSYELFSYHLMCFYYYYCGYFY